MNARLLTQMLESPDLPDIRGAVAKLHPATVEQEASAENVVRALECEPDLCERLLRVAETIFNGDGRPMRHLDRAARTLGGRPVAALAACLAMTTGFKAGCGGAALELAHWRRSLVAAVTARRLAERSELPCPEEAFFAGMLQDVGVLAMHRILGDRYAELLRRAPEHHVLKPLEQQKFALDHAQVSHALASRWQVPAVLCEAVRHHESPGEARQVVSEPELPLIDCLAVASRAADVLVGTPAGPTLLAYLRAAEHHFNLSFHTAETLLIASHEEATRVGCHFGLSCGRAEDGQALRSRIKETMVEFALVCEQQCRSLAEENRQLVRQASVDPLTGVANRRRFNQIMAEQFDKARVQETPLSLLFLDVDYLKEINDRHGHLVGDRMLIELADLLRQCVGERGDVARYGGEEFAVVLPTMDLSAAARMAEMLRRRINKMSIGLEGGRPLSMTASIGVATHQRRSFERVEQLIKAADQALYAAKLAGRNSVRLFNSLTAPAA